MRWPDFLVIGAAKAGTTALHCQLAKHPQLFLPRLKEPSFFGFEEAILPETGPGPGDRYGSFITKADDYLALFQDAPAAAKIGEVSPAYLYYSDAASAIAQRLPNVQLVAVLRNPVDRAWSTYNHLRRSHREPHTDFRKALIDEPQRIAAGWVPFWYYAKMGFYHEQLQRYFQRFSRNQIFVETYDTYLQQPKVFYQQLLEFLEVDSNWEIDNRRYNVGEISTESRLRTRLRYTPVGRLYRKLLPGRVRQQIQPAMIAPEPLDATLRAELTALYREDILRLQDLLQRDLGSWLAV